MDDDDTAAPDRLGGSGQGATVIAVGGRNDGESCEQRPMIAAEECGCIDATIGPGTQNQAHEGDWCTECFEAGKRRTHRLVFEGN